MMMSKQLIHTRYGEPASRSSKPVGSAVGSKMAGPSAPYTGRNRCIANNDTCEGPKAKGTDWCIGHLRAFEGGKDVA